MASWYERKSTLYPSIAAKGFNESLSIGRVQSPTVYLIYQRQKEIENFVSTTFYEFEGNIKEKQKR
ncbi:DNA topoisomerase [Bacillus sp. OxB-1]|uniref:DNA topoisomerase n=1 Tax=Bacillus sp. (strain OxB-1) TaxID=98228 RepID=UPI002F90A841